MPRMILADVNLTALARDIADLWTELTPADREELVRALGTYLDGVRSRLAAPDRRAGRPAAGWEVIEGGRPASNQASIGDES